MGKVLLSPEELKLLMASEPVVLIDTRNPEAFAAGHLPGAVNIHDIFTYLATSSPEGIGELKSKFAATFGAAGLSGAETAVVYEQSMNTGFGQSCRGYFLLSYLGYPKVAILHGGYEAWVGAGGATTAEPSSPVRKTFPIDESADGIMVDKDAVLDVVKSGSAVLLDVRDVDEWIADSSSPYGKDFCPRKGRIPGAKWIEWYRMMKPTGSGPMMKAPPEILAECATVGISAETPVVLYCFKGARASNTFVALKEAGVKDVKMYFGSWNEWSRDPSLPIESGFPQAG
ncbi:MAG TPA: sulfurtransferase [Hyphomicrobiaceae bacterium]|nr:sulfurtransferase [Hyphomicrobiaceae bacterium]